LALAVLPSLFFGRIAVASSTLDDDPINYGSSVLDDPIAQLETKIKNGEAKLAPERTRGYLAPLLKALNISASSQMLVFSKTSFQRQHIWPDSPRALYFNDDVYIGWVKGGEVVEIASMDPQKGTIFYT